MSFEDDLRRVEEHVAEARRTVQRQKGLIIRLRAAGVNTWDAQRILWLLESNLRRFEEHRDRLRASCLTTHCGRFSSCGSWAMLAAMRRASSRVISRHAPGQRRR